MRPLSVRWRNFRGFDDSGWVDIRPLTVVIGPNNSGKTSLHKPLLLLKQTLLADDANTGLVTRGAYASVGTYADIVFRRRTPRTLTLALRYVGSPQVEQKPRGAEPPAYVELSFRPDQSSSQIRLERYAAFDPHDRLLLSRRFSTSGYTVRLLGANFQLRDQESSPERRDYLTSVERAVRAHTPHAFLFTVAPVLEAVFPEVPADAERQVPRLAALYVGIANHTNQGIRGVLNSLSYVGPLRDAFERFYEPSGDRPSEVGVAGARAPEIIIARHNEPAFARWLHRWLAEFGFKGGLQVSDPTSGVHRITVKATAKAPAVNIADSGFGLSQVLPFIVHGIHSAPDSLLIAEQPEIHLNPRLHHKLADLFAAMVSDRRNVFVETHSEHFVKRVRYLIAAGKLSLDDVALLYVEKSGARSVVRNVPIEADGSIPEGSWPTGFFEESVKEAVDLLTAQRNVRA